MASTDLAGEPCFKRFAGGLIVCVQIEPPPAGRADATPLPDEGDVAEQCRFDRKDIVPSHVAAFIPALEHQHLKRIVGALVGMLHALIVARARAKSNA